MLITDIVTNLVNSLASITGWCTGNNEENVLIRTTSSFVLVNDCSGLYNNDDDSYAEDKQFASERIERIGRTKPMAGSTTTCLPDNNIHHDMEKLKKAVRKEDHIVWIPTTSSVVNVRGRNYMDDKKKVPSAFSLYELVEVDAVQSSTIYLDLGEKYNLDEFMQKEVLPSKADNIEDRRKDGGRSDKISSHKSQTIGKNDKTWNAPSYLIISFLLPTSAPKIAQKADANGFIVTAYYRIREETKDILRIISNPKYTNNEIAQLQKLDELSNKDSMQQQRINAIKLWEKWCLKAPHDIEMQKRLKFLPNINNLRDIGVANWICKYNGKPMLIKRPGVTNFVFSHFQDDRMEIDINMHPLPYMFKQAVSHIVGGNYMEQLIMTFAFAIESKDEDELPEVILGDPFILPFVAKAKVMQAKNIF